ncbi:TIGR02302 family protein [Labrys wisconsinensis]|uniref:Uncharacterized protein (TIGR02302 family) n=1 Tax=Labrys wisconsinensis TaxID=425677 RepID=A0ABU0JLU9_9HYPH|nr:TIGR02302 family protein [Labrys wisconsinensis]MDQ0475265.1 uncharacterized protein (TIGR02302 family) [Labrys wisconsinensis]
MADIAERKPPQPSDGARTRLGALVLRARLVLAWERLWPRLAPLLGVIGLFLAVSWFGLFLLLPFAARVALLALFGFGVLAALVPLARLRLPTTGEAFGRLDRETGLAHRPASALGDSLATAPADPVSRALWAAHQREAEAKTRGIRLKAPSPGLPARDRYGLRFAVILALVVSFFAAGPDRLALLRTAFEPSAVLPDAKAVRIDAWVTPPAYTRRPPIMLAVEPQTGVVSVPQNSVLSVRVAGDAGAEIAVTGQAVDAAPPATVPADAGTALVERRLTLQGDAGVTVHREGAEAAAFRFSIIPDLPPKIAFDGPIAESARGAMTLAYTVEDDYGATSIEARVALPDNPGAHPLYEPPRIALPLPAGRNHNGKASATRDVSEHPFAGATVKMQLVARDDAGNEGHSDEQEVTLPGRTFVKPLARALVEQRRKLALDARQQPAVEDALDALMLAPEQFTKDASIYLGLRTARVRLGDARKDEALRDVAQYLWQIALRIEEGDLSDAERELKAAQQRLRDALERGAPPEEIARLTQELRQAMNKFMQDYAQQLEQRRRNGDTSSPRRQADRTITPDELNAMIDRLENMARNGDKDQAQQLLSELSQLLENLQSPDQSETADDPAGQEMQRSLDEMGQMIQRQQRLRDQTFRNRQGQQGRDDQQDGAPQQGQEGDQQAQQDQGDDKDGTQGLRQRQQALREQLEALQKRLDQMGIPGNDDLGQAQQAMRDAEGKLGEGDGEGAVGSQGKAIEALRKGAQGLAKQMEQAQNGQGQGQGQGQPGRGQRSGRANGDRDPLGRLLRNDPSDSSGKVPGRGETDVERAARVLEELRRRFADPNRPQMELDYIDRLLRRD